MKTKSILLLLLASTFVATWGRAQPSREEVMTMQMPPPRYDVIKNLGYRGDYGYYLLDEARPDEGTSPNQWSFVLYRNTAAKDVWVSVSYAGPGCDHGHLTYGVWGKYEYKVFPGTAFAQTYRGYIWLGGGTESGDSTGGECVRTFDPSWARHLGTDQFGWGDEYVNVNLSQPGFLNFQTATASLTIKEIVVGAYATTHGEPGCGSFACRQPNWICLWTL
jgi:hypothetical protein